MNYLVLHKASTTLLPCLVGCRWPIRRGKACLSGYAIRKDATHRKAVACERRKRRRRRCNICSRKEQIDCYMFVSVPACTFNNSFVLFPSFCVTSRLAILFRGGAPSFSHLFLGFTSKLCDFLALSVRQRPSAARGDGVFLQLAMRRCRQHRGCRGCRGGGSRARGGHIYRPFGACHVLLSFAAARPVSFFLVCFW